MVGGGRLEINSLFLSRTHDRIEFPSIPFHSDPIQSIPFHSIPIHSIPFHFMFYPMPFVWDLVGNQEDRFSHNEAHMIQLAHLQSLPSGISLSHLLIARCDIGVQLSVRSFVRPSVRPQFMSRCLLCSNDSWEYETLHSNYP